MPTTIFARFESTRSAASALRAMRRESLARSPLRVMLHRGKLDSEVLPVGSTNARRRLLQGVVLGGVVGLVLALGVLRPLGLVTANLGAATMLALIAGVAIGALGGALTGAGSPERHLESLAQGLGAQGVLLSIEAPDEAVRERVAGILARHGGQLQPDAGPLQPDATMLA